MSGGRPFRVSLARGRGRPLKNLKFYQNFACNLAILGYNNKGRTVVRNIEG